MGFVVKEKGCHCSLRERQQMGTKKLHRGKKRKSWIDNISQAPVPNRMWCEMSFP
jgi:hypothetical protein